MVKYMNVEEQVVADFSRARRRALLRRMRSRLQRDNASNRLLCFDKLRKIPGALGRIYRGKRTVSWGHIVGSVKKKEKSLLGADAVLLVPLHKIGGAYYA